MNRILFLSLAFIFTSLFASAQEVEVSLKIVNEKSEAVSAATVHVFSIPDTLSLHQSVADAKGVVSLTLPVDKPYLVRITAVNYQPLEKSISVKSDERNFTFQLEPASQALGSVVVTARRPLMRQEDDKTIVDPENLALSSTNAYEIMEKVPGLFVDQDGNVYLNSTTPARVYINGREQKMSAADIATILKSLPPNAIQSIEILRTPSARYDASGSGGIVNVVLRKGIRIGLTGSINGGFNQGTYGNQFIGMSLNNQDGKLTQYINMQYSRRNGYEQLQSERFFSTDTLLRQNAYTRYPANSFYAGYGLGYQFSDKWELNYDGRYSHNTANSSSINASGIEAITAQQKITSNEATIDNITKSFNISQGLNLKNKLDDKGSEWTTDLSYNYSTGRTLQDFQTRYYEPVSAVTAGDGTIENFSRFLSAQTNLLNKMQQNITLETGLKTTHLWFNNGTDYFRMNGGSRIADNGRNASYQYRENINAAYLQASKTIDRIVIKGGVRLENTNMQGDQLTPKDTTFSIHRTDLFPYIYLSRGLMKIAGYELRAYLVYRRTIVRPAYENLNPSQRYVDPYLFETGNPSLRPQFTNNYEANISVDERPIFAVGVNEQKDIFTQVLYQADSARSQAYRTYDNLGKNKETYFRAIGAIPPGRRYFFVVGVQYTHNFYQGLYENKPIDFKRGSWTLFTYHNLKLGPNTQFSMHGFARFKGQLQFYELNSFGQLNMSINQQFLNKKLTLSLSATDIFYTNKNDFRIQQGSLNATGLRQTDSKRFGMNLRYNFGFRKKEENKLPSLDMMDNRP
ncbi:MAG: outer membrane beta-barrel protein [Flavisolibacter sp.]